MLRVRYLWRSINLLPIVLVKLQFATSSYATNVTIQLVRAEQPNQPVESAQQGNIIAYSRYRGPVTTWAFGINVDGKNFFDDGKKRRTILNLDLPEGEHVIQPGGHKFRITEGKIEGLSPDLLVQGNFISFRLYPVTFVASSNGGHLIPVWLIIKYQGKELWHSPPALFAEPLTLYMPATMESGYETNLSDGLLHISQKGAKFVPREKGTILAQFVHIDGFTVRIPSFNITAAILIDKPPEGAYGIWVSGREEATGAAEGYGAALGNWDPRPKGTFHASLQFSLSGWRFGTGVHEWILTAQDIRSFKHHIFIVDRAFYSLPDGKEKERILHIAISEDIVKAGRELNLFWQWVGVKGLETLKEPKLIAFIKQAPSFADEEQDWKRLSINEDAQGKASLNLPASIRPGIAWLRIGISESDKPKPTERLMAEVRLVVKRDSKETTKLTQPSGKLRVVQIGTPLKRSNVPPVLRQGVFIHPQSISALDISDDGQFIGVATMAFRNDKNFWLLSHDGKVLWGRYVLPWAPYQVAVMPGAKSFGMGLAYSRVTEPMPTFVLFQGERGEEIALEDAIWGSGWLRYGSGNWKTGWLASILGDLMVRSHCYLFTVMSNSGAWRMSKDGSLQRHPFDYQRPFRMAASTDGHVVAYGYLVPNISRVGSELGKEPQFPPEMRFPPAGLVVWNSLTAARLWSAHVMSDAPAVAKPQEPSEEFPEMAEEFGMNSTGFVPFRAVISMALNCDGSKVAITEYGGWIRSRRSQLIGKWKGHSFVPFIPRQRGWLRIFGSFGEELAKTQMPQEGMFDVHIDEHGERIWCVPMSWFSRGLAGCTWLPTDEKANIAFVYDLGKMAFTESWRFTDAISDFAVHGERILVSCWDGKVYLLNKNGKLEASLKVGSPARIRWSADGSFAVIGTQNGEVWCIEPTGKLRWQVKLPVAQLETPKEPLKPVFEEVPVYSVGRTGPEHAYVGDMWLIKTKEGAIMVDNGGTSSIPFTWQKMRAAGIDPKEVRYILLSHSHGDHLGAMYLWRTLGAKTVAPEIAAFATIWMVPTWNGYGIWVPCPIDIPLHLKRPGDEAEIMLCGVRIKAIFVPGHSIDSVVYAMELNGKKVVFSGDSFLHNTLGHCWGDVKKAKVLTELLRNKVLPIKPDFAFMGHLACKDAVSYLEKVLRESEESIAAALEQKD